MSRVLHASADQAGLHKTLEERETTVCRSEEDRGRKPSVAQQQVLNLLCGHVICYIKEEGREGVREGEREGGREGGREKEREREKEGERGRERERVVADLFKQHMRAGVMRCSPTLHVP